MRLRTDVRVALVLALAAAMAAMGCTPEEPGTDGGGPPLNSCGRAGTDSDNDGLIDTDEDVNGNGFVDVGECDPFQADTDSDGLIDSVEVGCDALYEPTSDTRCDLADTDGDGLTDGFEDNNANGMHDPAFGETDPTLEDTDGDTCTDGEEFGMGTDPNAADTDGDGIPDGYEDANCDGVIDPTDGETDPLLTDTDGDGIPDNSEPTFICTPPAKLGGGGLRDVELYEDDQGDWRVALEASSTDEGRVTTYALLGIAGVGALGQDVRSAGRIEYTETPPGSGDTIDVAGFVLSIPLDANGDGTIDTSMEDASAVRDRLLGLMNTVFSGAGSSTLLRSTGSTLTSWEGFDAVVGAVVEVTMGTSSTAGDLRDMIIPAFLGVSASSITGLGGPVGSSDGTFIVSFEALWRAGPDTSMAYPGRAVILGGVTRAVDYDDNSSVAGVRLGDLAGGGSLAQFGDGEDIECDPFVASVPKADIVWAMDDSGSTVSYRTSIKDNAIELFNRALAAGLDFRMGVISLGTAAADGPRAGFICDPPFGPISAGLGTSCDFATPPPPMGGLGCGAMCHGNSQPNEGRWIYPSELDEFSWCVCYPPNGDIETEAGLDTMRAAVLGHLPRSTSDPLKIRPDAALSVIFVTDEEPDVQNVPGTWTDMSPTGAMPGTPVWNDFIQPMIDLFSGIANPANLYPPGANPGEAMARVHGMLDLSGTCYPPMTSYGYAELINLMGGVTGSVCAPSLGPTMQIIIDDIIGSASPLWLDRTPIAPSMACAIGDTEVARSRSMGFDYNGANGTVIFFGFGTTFVDTDVACSYRYFVDDTPFSEGPGVGVIE